MAEVITLVQWTKPVEPPHGKKCKKCLQEKDKDAFKVDHSCSDNRRYICIECEKERDRRNKEAKAKRNAEPDPNIYFTF